MNLEISVVIPLYNKERYIKRTIDSVLSQTFQGFELIIVDSSNDGSTAIVNQYKDSRIIHLLCDKSNAAKSRNIGVQNAKSDFIAFLDADDEWMPDHLETLLTLKKKYPDAGLFSTSYVKLKPNGEPLTMLFVGIPKPPWEGYLSQYLKICSFGDEPVNSSSVAIKRDVFSSFGGFSEDLVYGEDQFLWGKIALSYPVAYSWNGLAIYHTEALDRICNEPHLIHEHPFSLYLMDELAGGRISEASRADCLMYIKRKKQSIFFSNLPFSNKSSQKKEADTEIPYETVISRTSWRVEGKFIKIIGCFLFWFYHSPIHDLFRKILCWIYQCHTPGLTREFLFKRLPRISIITPSYQQGEFIEETIKSVTSQKYPSLEYIVIDGGSSDDSVNKIRRYDAKITCWVSEPDYGQTDALNKGFRLATGEIVGWINSDDVLMPEALLKVGAFFSEHPDVSLIYGNALAIGRTGNIIGLRRSGEFNFFWLIRTDDIPQSSVFFRRNLLESIGYLDVHLRYAMDYDLLVKAALKQDPMYLPDILSGFRVYPETKTSRGKIFFLADIVYFTDKLVKNTRLTQDRKSSLITMQFWRTFEIILSVEMGKVNLRDLDNHPEVKEIVTRYYHLLYPHFLRIIEKSSLPRRQDLDTIMMEAMLSLTKSFFDDTSLPNVKLSKMDIRYQTLDILIFSFRLWHAKKRKSAVNLVMYAAPYLLIVLIDPQFWRIVKTSGLSFIKNMDVY